MFLFCWIQVNPKVVDKLEENGLMFVGRDVDNERMEILELKGKQCSVLLNVYCLIPDQFYAFAFKCSKRYIS